MSNPKTSLLAGQPISRVAASVDDLRLFDSWPNAASEALHTMGATVSESCLVVSFRQPMASIMLIVVSLQERQEANESSRKTHRDLT